MAKRVRMKCAACGSTNVLRDAWAEWDEDQQLWALQNVFDAAFCEDCDGATHIDSEEIEPVVAREDDA